jgi:hypothetical protein
MQPNLRQVNIGFSPIPQGTLQLSFAVPYQKYTGQIISFSMGIHARFVLPNTVTLYSITDEKKRLFPAETNH